MNQSTGLEKPDSCGWLRRSTMGAAIGSRGTGSRLLHSCFHQAPCPKSLHRPGSYLQPRLFVHRYRVAQKRSLPWEVYRILGPVNLEPELLFHKTGHRVQYPLTGYARAYVNGKIIGIAAEAWPRRSSSLSRSSSRMFDSSGDSGPP